MLKTLAILGFSLLVLIPFSNPNTIEWKKDHEVDMEKSVCPVRMLLIGGIFENYFPTRSTMEIYYPDTPSKNHLVNVSLLVPRYGHISELLNDHMVITCAGENGDVKDINSCEIFDLHTNKVTMASNMTEYHDTAASAVLDGVPYVCGGEHNGPLASCERYQSGVWTKVASMSTDRELFAMVVLDGHLLAIGGHDGVDDLNSVERYDPVNNRWSLMKPMLDSRNSHAAAVIGKSVFVCGGDATIHPTGCESYDLNTNTWSYFPKMITVRFSFKMVAAGGRLFATSEGTVDMYDPKQRKWFPTSRTTARREYASAVALPCSK